MQYQPCHSTANGVAVDRSTSLVVPSSAPDQSQSKGEFHCTLCGAALKTKSTCKRHLVDVHLSGRLKCQTCDMTVPRGTKIEECCAYKGQCYAPNYRHTISERTVYACPVTGKCFDEIKPFVSHSIEWCNKPKDTRPSPNRSRQIFGILKHLRLLWPLAAASARVGTHFNWAPIQLSGEVASRAVRELERIELSSTGDMRVRIAPSGEEALLEVESYLEKLLLSGQPLQFHPPQELRRDLLQGVRYIYACEGTDSHFPTHQDAFGDSFKPTKFVNDQDVQATSSTEAQYPYEQGEHSIRPDFAQHAGYLQIAGSGLPYQRHGGADMQPTWSQYTHQTAQDNQNARNMKAGATPLSKNDPFRYHPMYSSPDEVDGAAVNPGVNNLFYNDFASRLGDTRGSLTSPSSYTNLWLFDEDLDLGRRRTNNT